MSRSRILLVDDNELNLELMTDVLESAGYQVQLARTGEEALLLARSEAPELILMDIGLPGMDGYATVKELKADHRTSGIPTVAVTAFAMAGDAERATTAGFDGYITKPIATRTLPATVARLLQEGGAR